MSGPLINALSADLKVPAVQGENTEGGAAVLGICGKGHGVRGESKSSRGVVGMSTSFHGVFGYSESNVGVAGESKSADAVWGVAHASDKSGVLGTNDKGGTGVSGYSDTFRGVYGHSKANAGVVGESDNFDGVWGVSSEKTKSGVFGLNKVGGTGVTGESTTWRGVYGHSGSNAGVVGESDTFDGVWGIAHDKAKSGVFGLNKDGGTGVTGESTTWHGVYGHSGSNAGVVGESDTFDGVWGIAHDKTKSGIVGKNLGGGLAGYFDGNVVITGDLTLPNADCAEDFDIAGPEAAEPGSVMVLGTTGGLAAGEEAYDKRVAGVVSGAGDFKPGIVLDKQALAANRQPIALMGKVFCKVDADFGAVEIGDLLTSSPTRGHAMRASDPQRAFGAVVGKALRPLASGRGLVPILVALQ